MPTSFVEERQNAAIQALLADFHIVVAADVETAEFLLSKARAMLSMRLILRALQQEANEDQKARRPQRTDR